MDRILNAARAGHIENVNISQDQQNLSWLKENIRYLLSNDLLSDKYIESQLEKAVQNNWEKSVEYLVRFLPNNRGLSKNILNIAIRNGNTGIINDLMPLGDENDARMLANIFEVEESLKKYNTRKKNIRLSNEIIEKYINQGPDTNQYIKRNINKYLEFGRKRSRRSRKRSRRSRRTRKK